MDQQLAASITAGVIYLKCHPEYLLGLIAFAGIAFCARMVAPSYNKPPRNVKPHNDFREDDIYNGKSDRI